MHKVLYLTLLILFTVGAKAQTTVESPYAVNSHGDWEALFEQLGQEEDYQDETTWENMHDVLSELAENPININTARKETLEEIPFLNANQIEEIIKYLDYHNGMRTVQEMRMIESLSRTECSLLTCFIYCGDNGKTFIPALKDIIKYGKQEITATVNIPTYRHEGDIKGYRGYQFKHSLRYMFNYGNRVKAGFVGSQDAGEPFFTNKNSTGYDFYSYFLQLKDFGKLKSLVIGRYRVSFGMGLVINNNLSFGKYATLMTIGTNRNNIHGHSSRTSANYMQGIAATYEIMKDIDVSVFASYRNIDATLNKDGSIATIIKTGYHRTDTELAKKDNASQTVFGANARWASNGYHIGITGYYSFFDKELKPDISEIYKRYYPSGNKFSNMGIDYGYTATHLQISGETATGKCGHIATINTVSWQPMETISVSAIQRFYSYRYYSLFSQSISDCGHVQNECGGLLSIKWNALPNLSIMAYTDYAYFTWARYHVRMPSKMWDNMLEATLSMDKYSISGRYRFKTTEKDNITKTALTNDNEQYIRIRASYTTDKWDLRTQGDFTSSVYKTSSKGWMVSQNISCQTIKGFRIYANFGYFNTEDYNSRIYTYEHSILYTFSFPAFYGEGVRYSLNIRGEISHKIIAEIKAGTTKYFDRNTIGSGLQEINKCYQTDVQIQLRIKLP